MLSALFALVIQPIVQILEFFFTLFREITKNAGLSVVGLSLVVTLCTLPLYIIAEKWQETERQIEDKPEQYCYVENYSSPFVFLHYTFFQAVGLFVFWSACFFALFQTKVKKALCLFGVPVCRFCRAGECVRVFGKLRSDLA